MSNKNISKYSKEILYVLYSNCINVLQNVYKVICVMIFYGKVERWISYCKLKFGDVIHLYLYVNHLLPTQ